MENEIIEIFFNLEKFEASEYDKWGKDNPGVNHPEVNSKLFMGINRFQIKEDADVNQIILFTGIRIFLQQTRRKKT